MLTLDSAISDNITSSQLRAVANRNIEMANDAAEKRDMETAYRLKAQAEHLGEIASQIDLRAL